MTQTNAPFFILVVAPRPAKARDALSYATLEGVIEGFESQGARVAVEHLRPATAAALSARLRDAQMPRVDLVIVDGALTQGAELAIAMGAGQEAQPMGIGALSNLLIQADSPLAMLHLCPFGGTDDDTARAAEGLATQAGASVLWLRPGLSAGAARACMAELLTQLLAGEALSAAIAGALQAASLDDRCTGDPMPALQLYGAGDWRRVAPHGLPPGTDPSAPPSEQRARGPLAALLPLGAPGALPDEPSWGLIGRNRELAEIEHLLAADDAGPVWVYGYDGVGKTTLVGRAARWLTRTGRFARVVYTSLARSGLATVALYDLGRCLVGPDFVIGPDAAETIAAAMRTKPTLVIWDDFQSVLPGGDYSSSAEAMSEWYRLAGLLAATAPSRLCILSDGPDLPASARRLHDVQSIEIGLLADAEGERLLIELCRQLDAPQPEAGTLRSLVGALGAHPLALRVMAAQFAGTRPEAVVEELLADLPGLASGEARFRNQGLEIAFDRLLLTLPEALRSRLPSIGLSAGGLSQNIGIGLLGLEPEDWDSDVQLFLRAGLAQAESITGLTAPYVRIHPAFKRLARQRLDQRARQRVRVSFGGLYAGLASWLLQTLERAPEQVAALVYHDLGNLGTALDLILEEQDLVLAISYGRVYTQLLEIIGFGDEAKRVTERVQEAVGKAIPREGSLGRPGVLLLWSQADRMMDQGQPGPASALLRQLAERMGAQGGLSYVGQEADLDRARTLRRLGRALRLFRRGDLALSSLRRALELLSEPERDPTFRRERAETLVELAEALMAVGQFAEAAQECQRGLQNLEGLGERALEGSIYVRLGTLAMRQDQPEEARFHYGQALDRLRAADDAAGMAAIESQLATLAMRPPADLGRARAHLMDAVAHARKSENAPLEGQLIVQQAQVAMQGGDLAEAEGHFRQALDLYRERNILPGMIATRASLAEFLLRQGRADEAKVEAEAAQNLAQVAGADVIPWELFLLLQRIAQARNDAEGTSRWRTATQQAFARSTQAGPIRMRWQPIIKAAAQGARGEAMDAEAAETIEEMETTADWQPLGRAIMRILSGERDESLLSDLDHVSALIARAILEAISEQNGEESSDKPVL